MTDGSVVRDDLENVKRVYTLAVACHIPPNPAWVKALEDMMLHYAIEWGMCEAETDRLSRL